MKPIYSIKDSSVKASFKDVDGKKGIVTGYFSHFNNVDSDGDIIRPGAFTKSIMETGPNSTQPRIKHLLNHNTNQALGVLTSLSEDTSGLLYESQIGTHNLGVDFIKMVESGLITEHSIGFQTLKMNMLQDYDGYKSNPDGGWYEITEAKCWEGSSLQCWGANPLTPLTSMKGELKENWLQELIDKQARIEKFCRNSTATDETIELLLIETKQLTQLIFNLSKSEKSTQPDNTTVPVDWIDAIKTFNNSLIKN